MDMPDDPDTRHFVQLYSQLGFHQFIAEPIIVKGHILDIVLSRAGKIVRSLTVENLNLSDHFFLVIGTDLSKPRVIRKAVKCRNVRGIGGSQFLDDLAQSPPLPPPPTRTPPTPYNRHSRDVNDLVDLYNASILGLLNKHAPEREKVVPDSINSAWTDEAVIRAKQSRRCAQRKKRKTGLVVHMELFKQARNILFKKKAIKREKARHFPFKLEEAVSDSKKMFSLLSTLLNRQDRNDSLPGLKPQEFGESFSRFFNDKFEISKVTVGE